MKIEEHSVLLALLPLSIICIGTVSVSALHSPIPTALALTIVPSFT
ncbi:MAG: hypothetical protein HWQ38_04415 [Nostoc sp. NMS7]|nr:hypothetical protein [Nostoc sp. NMS7]MBN3945753.1 hypothetical protein [Nostoc sp. NMS7]